MPDNTEGDVGYMPHDRYARFEWAMHHSTRLVSWLRIAGYIKAGEVDVRVQSSTDRPLGLPPTWLAAEEITRLSNELNQWGELTDAANDEWGAEVAWMFTKEVENARAKWPYEDRPHNIRHMRCQDCDGLTLQYRPPRSGGDDIRVRCKDRECGAVMDGRMFALTTALIESENDVKRRA